MPETNIDYRPHDQQIWDEELANFVPKRIVDCHCHLWQISHIREVTIYNQDRYNADIAFLRAWAAKLYPGRQYNMLLLGAPLPGVDVAAHEAFVKEQIKNEPNIRHNRLVTPKCKLEDIRRDMQTPKFVGFKPYRTFSVTGDVNNCRIQDFLLPEQMELANELGLWVTMHLSQPHGCADEQNLKDLEEYTNRRYPKIKWILAHCARSFTYWPIQQAVERLRDMPNIFYDVSAVTDVRPHVTLYKKENIKRIFFGSDATFAAYFHGQYPALGRAWQALNTDKTEMKFPHTDGRPILSVYEQLLSMKHAAGLAGLSKDDVNAIFWGNATREFGFTW